MGFKWLFRELHKAVFPGKIIQDVNLRVARIRENGPCLRPQKVVNLHYSNSFRRQQRIRPPGHGAVKNQGILIRNE